MRRRSHAARAARAAVLVFCTLVASLAAAAGASARPITQVVLAPDAPWAILVPKPVAGSFSGEREERLAMLERRLAELSAPPGRDDVVAIALRHLGVPYRWGGSSPAGFDCSGFIMYVYAQIGVPLPHNAAAQYGYGMPVSRSELQPGDLVFFNGLGHAGIYVGDGEFVHAPHSGDVVHVARMAGWYDARYVGARRL